MGEAITLWEKKHGIGNQQYFATLYYLMQRSHMCWPVETGRCVEWLGVYYAILIYISKIKDFSRCTGRLLKPYVFNIEYIQKALNFSTIYAKRLRRLMVQQLSGRKTHLVIYKGVQQVYWHTSKTLCFTISIL